MHSFFSFFKTHFTFLGQLTDIGYNFKCVLYVCNLLDWTMLKLRAFSADLTLHRLHIFLRGLLLKFVILDVYKVVACRLLFFYRNSKIETCLWLFTCSSSRLRVNHGFRF